MYKIGAKEELAISSQDGVGDSQQCESLAYIPMKISIPISLEPCVKKLPITACINKQAVLEETSCGTFILTQELCVKVPIEITIKSDIGNTTPGFGKLPNGNLQRKPRYKYTPNVVVG